MEKKGKVQRRKECHMWKTRSQGNRNVLDSVASRPHSGPTMQTAGLNPEQGTEPLFGALTSLK